LRNKDPIITPGSNSIVGSILRTGVRLSAPTGFPREFRQWVLLVYKLPSIMLTVVGNNFARQRKSVVVEDGSKLTSQIKVSSGS
jgi:hypothetical protein